MFQLHCMKAVPLFVYNYRHTHEERCSPTIIKDCEFALYCLNLNIIACSFIVLLKPKPIPEIPETQPFCSLESHLPLYQIPCTHLHCIKGLQFLFPIQCEPSMSNWKVISIIRTLACVSNARPSSQQRVFVYMVRSLIDSFGLDSIEFNMFCTAQFAVRIKAEVAAGRSGN